MEFLFELFIHRVLRLIDAHFSAFGKAAFCQYFTPKGVFALFSELGFRGSIQLRTHIVLSIN